MNVYLNNCFLYILFSPEQISVGLFLLFFGFAPMIPVPLLFYEFYHDWFLNIRIKFKDMKITFSDIDEDEDTKLKRKTTLSFSIMSKRLSINSINKDDEENVENGNQHQINSAFSASQTRYNLS